MVVDFVRVICVKVRKKYHNNSTTLIYRVNPYVYMADKSSDKAPDKAPDTSPIIEENTDEETVSIPSPRFDLISKMFGEIDEVLASNDQENNLTVFEMEILILMLRKKIDHLGIMAAMEGEHTHEPVKGNTQVYG
jgi:hypothetical protein